MIVPNRVDERLPFGGPKFVLLSRLNASMRASRRVWSPPRPKVLCRPEIELVERRAARDVARRVAERLRAIGRDHDAVAGFR